MLNLEKSGDGVLALGGAVYTGALTVDEGGVSIASGNVRIENPAYPHFP
ncbi:hypothetical protein [Akkermansia muciniphila]